MSYGRPLLGGGYNSEAWSYISALNKNVEFWEGLPLEMRHLDIELYQTECKLNQGIVVYHSEPKAWYPLCFKPFLARPLVMVSTDFHINTFTQSGVDPIKVRKIVQPVDLGFLIYELNLEQRFAFLSVFKWEYRKRWDVLLRSYLKEFDDVALYLLMNVYHSDGDLLTRLLSMFEDFDLEKPINAQVNPLRLYVAANAFVLSSRGEGWGRLIMDAMAMPLLVITTTWSRPNEYLTDENSYPIPFEGMSEVKEGPFKGHMHVMSNPGKAKSKEIEARLDMMRKFFPEIVVEDIINHLQGIVDNFH
ncbi:hypothetical protein Pfo_015460 [Paulownia fortunei]|nr:hypothetical protein Pfo_015460 [Paulownia fortunei]